MKLLSTFSLNKNQISGISLIEVIIVVAIMLMILTFGLSAAGDSRQGNTFRASRDLLISALQHARSQAINNICLGATCANGKPHGVHIGIDSDRKMTGYVIFQGMSYDPADSLNTSINISGNTSRNISLAIGSDTDIYFEQLSGNSISALMKLSSGIENSIININPEGAIKWTN